MAYYLTNDELYHHGILGMKWGVRRFQNPDGTLTPEGKRRYKLDANGKYVKRTRAERKAYDKKVKQLQEAAKAKKVKSPRDKDIKQMTDKQLQKYIDRMTAEKKAIELRNDINRIDPKPLSRGEKYTKYMLDKVVTPMAQDAGRKAIDALVKAAFPQEVNKYDQAKKDAEYWKNMNTAEQQRKQYEKSHGSSESKGGNKTSKVMDFLKKVMLEDDPGSSGSSGSSNSSKQSKSSKPKTETVNNSGNKKAEPKSNSDKKGPEVFDAEFKVKNESDVNDFVASFYQTPLPALDYDPDRWK